MGAIREVSSGRLRLLEPESLVGRASACALRIDARYVSAQHAVVRWRAPHWEVRDLGSRNGTYLEGVRLVPGQTYPLRSGSKLVFGKAHESEWELTDAAAPGTMAVPLDGADPVLLDTELLVLPRADNPKVTIYKNPDGEWVIEHSDEETVPVRNAQLFEVEGRAYRFSCPDPVWPTTIAGTAGDFEIADVALTFLVSSDEEYVEVRAQCGSREVLLGARAFNFLLLTLARRRLADAALAKAEPECGWFDVEQLGRDPTMAPPQLNVDVFRIRQHFAASKVTDGAGIVERRGRPSQLRIGTGKITIVRT